MTGAAIGETALSGAPVLASELGGLPPARANAERTLAAVPQTRRLAATRP